MRLRIYQQKRALGLLGERDEERQLGEMAHLALYFLEAFTGSLEELERAVDRALALYAEPLPEREKYREKLLKVLSQALAQPEIARFFAPGLSDLREHPFLLEAKRGEGPKVYRPDRVLFLPEGPVVLEYKLRLSGLESLEAHRGQLRTYLRALAKILGSPPRGYLIYLTPPEIREVAPDER